MVTHTGLGDDRMLARLLHGPSSVVLIGLSGPRPLDGLGFGIEIDPSANHFIFYRKCFFL